MNIREYLINPMGKGSSILMLMDTRKSLDEQYQKIKERIRIKWYNLNEKYYIAHIKIPSMTHDKLFYDVLLEFDIDSIKDNQTILNDGNVRVFSNCPSFTYTFANVFYKNRDLIDWAKPKYSKEIIQKDPVTRNPNELRSYERSLYFAIKYVLSNGRNYVARVKTVSTTIHAYRNILNNIKTNTEIEDLYKSYTAEKNKRNELDKKNQSTKEKQNVRKHTNTKKGVTKTTKTTSTVKTTKKIKKTKKI